MAGPSNPHRPLPTPDLAAKGIAGEAECKPAARSPGPTPDGAVIIAAITSCTNTTNPRNVIAAALLARNANALGLTRKPWVKTSLAPGSKAVELYLEEAGLLAELEKLGFGIVGFACTTCNGMSGALDPASSKKSSTATCTPQPCSRATATSTAAFTPMPTRPSWRRPRWWWPTPLRARCASILKKTCWAEAQGRHIRLKDLWPSDEEIDAMVQATVKPSTTARCTSRCSPARTQGDTMAPLYDWRPQSTYIRRPPYWDTEGVGALAASPRTLKGMRPLAVLPDNITTDHLSPSNAILAGSAAGEYLARMGLPEEDFNSYATHRGDHLTALRATFANPTLKNEMVRKSDGTVNPARWRALSPKARTCACGRPSKPI